MVNLLHDVNDRFLRCCIAGLDDRLMANVRFYSLLEEHHNMNPGQQ